MKTNDGKVALQAIAPSDVGGRYWVECKIRPENVQDKLAKIQAIQGLRNADGTGRPFLADEDIRQYLGISDDRPEEYADRIDQQLLEAADPDIQAIKKAAVASDWKKAHKDQERTADKILNPPNDQLSAQEKLIKSLTPEMLQQIVKLAGGMPPDQFGQTSGQDILQSADQQLAQQQMLAMLPQSVQPPGQAPMGQGVMPTALPSQTFMPQGAPPALPPAVMANRQVARGRPINTPGR